MTSLYPTIQARKKAVNGMAKKEKRAKLKEVAHENDEDETQVQITEQQRVEREQQLARDDSLSRMTDSLVTAFFIALAIKILSFLYTLHIGADSEL